MSTRTRIETRARARVLQALYAWDVSGEESLLQVSDRLWEDLRVPPGQREIAEPLVRTIAERRRDLDTQLADVTTNWRLERLGVVERSLLRLGAAELIRGETPPRVVIQEMVKLGERFAGVPSAKFVNGVLDALARRMGRI
jgi:N utilization substance protein B